jgi:hypothetical protein
MLFLQSSKLGPPTPLPDIECVPSLFGSEGEGHSLAGEGVGRSQFGRGNRHCGTQAIYICTLHYFVVSKHLYTQVIDHTIFHKL